MNNFLGFAGASNTDAVAEPIAPAAASTPLGTSMTLLAAAFVAIPFNQRNWPPAQKPAPSISRDYYRQNPTLYPNPIPFAQYYWPRVTKPAPSVSREYARDPSRYPNPIPFAQFSWPRVNAAAPQPLPQAQPNTAIWLADELAFFVIDWSSSFAWPYGPAPQAPPYNPNLFSEVPFAQFAWPRVVPVAPPPPQARPSNPNLFSEVPFAQYQWPRIHYPVSSPPPQARPYNANVYTNPIPFAQYSWVDAAPFANRIADVSQTWQNFYGAIVVSAPFYQSSWPVAAAVRSAPAPIAPYNAKLFTNPIPFALYDWRPSSPLKSRAADVYPSWQNFYGVVLVSAPFYQSTWPAVSPVKSATQSIVYRSWQNFYAAPFAQYDWPRAVVRLASLPPATPPNPNLFSEVPFAQYDWPNANRRPASPQDAPVSNLVIALPAFPFAQHDWPTPQPVIVRYAATQRSAGNLTVTLTYGARSEAAALLI